MSDSFDDFPDMDGFRPMLRPDDVAQVYQAVRESVQQMRQHLPDRQELADFARERMREGIDSIASRPTLGDYVGHYTPSFPGSLFSALGYAGSHAASSAQLALNAADGVNAMMGGERGQIQERFAEAANNAVDNAAVRLPQALTNAREGFAYSWNPFTGQRLLAQVRMQNMADGAAMGEDMHQTPVFSASQVAEKE
jgi:hypothetical protein